MKTTDQVSKKIPNPSGKGGFADNPDNRNPGGWSKKDSLRFKIEQASYLDNEELQAIVDDPKEATLLRKFAEATLQADWKMIKEITEMLYGKPKESIDLSNPDGTLTPVIRIIDERQKTT
jgi:hypothetical protein